MNNNNTSNVSDDANTFIPIALTYDADSSNGNGGHWNVLGLTGNTELIEYNHIGQNTRKDYVRTLTDILVWVVDNMPENLLVVKPSKGKTQRTWVL